MSKNIAIEKSSAEPVSKTMPLYIGICRMNGTSLWNAVAADADPKAVEGQLLWWKDRDYSDPRIIEVEVPSALEQSD